MRVSGNTLYRWQSTNAVLYHPPQADVIRKDCQLIPKSLKALCRKRFGQYVSQLFL